MRFYLVDDDPNILKILEGIIRKEGLGSIAGSSTNPLQALTDIKAYEPDIILVDYLMPGMDGAALVRTLRKELPQLAYVIISQVSDKDMIGESYEAGIEFFIQKPINIIEVRGVLSSLVEKIEMRRALNQINGLLRQTSSVEKTEVSKASSRNERSENIERILSRIGILGERGANDILACSEALVEKGIEHRVSSHLNGVCESLGHKPKIMKQRMRRSLQSGLRNIATLGIEDYLNDVFVNYSATLFEFEEVKAEMDSLRGIRKQGGRVSVTKFIESLIVQSRIED